MAKGERTRFVKTIRAFADQVQDLENAIYDLKTLRLFEYAEGVNLDNIGNLVGIARDGSESDEIYREKILLKIQLNKSCGEPETLITAFKAFSGITDCSYREYYPASAFLKYESDVVPGSSLKASLQRLAPVGVNLIIERNYSTGWFAFSDLPSTSETNANHGFADVAQLTGGKLSQIL